MKRYKKLQNIANESLGEFHNEEVANELRAIIQDNANRGKYAVRATKRKRILISSLASLIVVIVAIFAGLSFLDINHETKKYNKANQIAVESDLSSLNADLSYFVLALNSSAVVSQVIDNYYNETLYYNVKLVYESGVMIEINVVTNKNYSFVFEHELDKTVDINKFPLFYGESYETLDDSLYLVEVFGSIDTDKEKIYISYNEITSEENNNFIDFMRQILRTN